MSGASYSSCGVDGDYDMAGPDGEVLFEMGLADYGSQSTHTFCVSGVGPPPCAQPYPEVTGLNATVQSAGVLLQWNPIVGSIGCQVQGGVIGGGNASVTVSQPEASQLFVGNNSLQAGQNYQWRVRCGCSANPLIAGPWSPYDQFSSGAAKDRSTATSAKDDFKIAPNPANGFTQLFLNSNETSIGVIALFDISGKLVLQQNIVLTKGANTIQLDLTDHEAGLYLLNTQWGNEAVQSKLVIQ
ncbi:MAG: hypothetical protein ACJAY4_001078 [Cryomorphaceae bacterium]|jgi:hypothetical protein